MSSQVQRSSLWPSPGDLRGAANSRWPLDPSTERAKRTYRSLDLDLVLAVSVIEVQRLIHDQDSLDWVGQNEGVVFVSSLFVVVGVVVEFGGGEGRVSARFARTGRPASVQTELTTME